jgi:ribosomal protein S18 acetylase RimI-like enzyme
MHPSLRFVPIDLARHRDVCVRFRRDATICSFGDDGRFERESGADGSGYLDWLRERISELPLGCVHVWQGDEIIGQMEMRHGRTAGSGYVNLFYLVPAQRGMGKSILLHDYAAKLFQSLGKERMQLCVAPANHRAVHFYRKAGWVDLGPRPGQADVHLMEFRLQHGSSEVHE